jgi:hypothetical protein
MNVLLIPPSSPPLLEQGGQEGEKIVGVFVCSSKELEEVGNKEEEGGGKVSLTKGCSKDDDSFVGEKVETKETEGEEEGADVGLSFGLTLGLTEGIFIGLKVGGIVDKNVGVGVIIFKEGSCVGKIVGGNFVALVVVRKEGVKVGLLDTILLV